MEVVILLNADYSYLNTIKWKKALTLLAKGKVSVLKYGKRVIKTSSGIIMKIPVVLRLIKFIRTVYRTKVPFSKKNVMIRDGMKCTYCGDKNARLTIDHIVPKSKGGKSTFENTVAACKPCNNKKGSKTCAESKMYPRANAHSPTISEFLGIKMRVMGVDKIIEDLVN
jgi:5-methylcytosine-specific restriction endonuclease McrA